MFKRLTSNKSSSRIVPYLSKYPHGSIKDCEMLSKLSDKERLDFLYLQVRNIWRVDGLYYLRIEEMFDTDVATKIDTEIWKTMAIIEAKSLRRMFNIKDNGDIQTIMSLLLMSSWALDQPFKRTEISDKKAILSIDGFDNVYKTLQQQVILRGQSQSTLNNYIRRIAHG